MPDRNQSKSWAILIIFLMFVAIIFLVDAQATEQGNTNKSADLCWIITTISLLFLVIGGGLGYVFVLQKRFLKVCEKEKQLSVFFQSPAGLPAGTVRAIIALIIITISLYLAVLLFFEVAGDQTEFPQVLSGLLGAVIGFYFGNRTALAGQEQITRQQVKNVQEQRDKAVQEKDDAESRNLIRKINKGIAMSKTVAALLPKNLRKKYDDFVEKLQHGTDTVEELAKIGNFKEALTKAEKIFDSFKKGNPVIDIFTKALELFGKVLGGTVHALAIISTIVEIGTKLTGTLYQKSKTRILNAPFSPAELPLRVVDASTGFTLLRSSPTFRKVFSKECEEKNWPFMESTLKLLHQEDVEQFWEQYKDRFDSRGQFDEGVKQFRRAAVDMELQEDIDPALFSEAGGRKPFMDSLDAIHKDPDAKEALDALVTVIEGLHQNGEPVKAIFDKVRKEVKL